MEFKGLLAIGTFGGLFVLAMFWINAGVLTDIEISESETGPFSFAYINYTGDPSELYTKIDRVYYDLQDAGIDSQVGIGVFFDYAKDNISLQQKKAIGGYIISGRDVSKVETMETFRITTLAKKPRIYAEYPLKSQMSIKAGRAKAYSKIEKYVEENNLKPGISIELYDTNNQKVVYMIEIKE